MDILKSLRPLALSLNPTSSNTFVKLRERRSKLSGAVTDLINELGPEMFEDFDHARLVADPFREGAVDESDLPRSPSGSSHRRTASDSPAVSSRHDTVVRGLTAHEQLPTNESFHDLGQLGFFSTRPPSRSRSRSNSNSGGLGEGLKGLSTITGQRAFDEVAAKIRGAMRERGHERRRNKSESSWEFAGSGVATPSSDDGKKDA